MKSWYLIRFCKGRPGKVLGNRSRWKWNGNTCSTEAEPEMCMKAKQKQKVLLLLPLKIMKQKLKQIQKWKLNCLMHVWTLERKSPKSWKLLYCMTCHSIYVAGRNHLREYKTIHSCIDHTNHATVQIVTHSAVHKPWPSADRSLITFDMPQCSQAQLQPQGTFQLQHKYI